MDTKCKLCRRAGEKLYLKGERCYTPKCAFERKKYPPGRRDSERKHRSILTPYGMELREKQKVRNHYRLSEKQFINYVKNAISAQDKKPAEKLFEQLELRLDSVTFRLGLAKSRSMARQLVSHGHITVNGRRVTVPSYSVREGDIITIRKASSDNKLFGKSDENDGNEEKKTVSLSWLTFDTKKREAKVLARPNLERDGTEYNLVPVIGFYSR